MNQFFEQKMRLPFLILICTGVWFSCLKILFSQPSPSIPQAVVTVPEFPENVPIPSWKSLPKPLEIKERSDPDLFPQAETYYYQQNNRVVQVEMRLVTNEEDARTLMKQYANISQPVEIREHPNQGFYAVTANPDYTYLTACINARGHSTVTHLQFKQNGYRYGLDGSRLLAWLTREQPLRDPRCFWTLIIMPASDVPLANPLEGVEEVWTGWYDWWRSHLRNLPST
ncbi:cyanoexosortase A system-associated protein [Spirulina subsalsa FACHB-351]|uniref:Cyanoexosortase A system-associated protein n=1 Tax=Spirulina subsalsa FACHB-351 TaxID=234711 RepID=A0ABT3L4C1_9CYAN|nr:cyanoexosortase A system-associated protein [Spirulina subsalsa]MCW6036349.1 cyanoexosortase A system-associated protein [Spirulina subsalsa FACHB-351]